MYKKEFPPLSIEALPKLGISDVVTAAGQIAAEYLRPDRHSIYEIFSKWYVEQGLRTVDVPFLERYHDQYQREGEAETLNAANYAHLLHIRTGGGRPPFVASADVWQNTLTAWRPVAQRLHPGAYRELLLEPVVSQPLRPDGSFGLPLWDLPRQASLIRQDEAVWFGEETWTPHAMAPFHELVQAVEVRIRPPAPGGTSSVAS